MNILTIFMAIGQFLTGLLGKAFSWKFLFGAGLGFGTKILRIFGLIVFISTIIIAVNIGMNTEGTYADKAGASGLEIVKTVVGVDQYIYELSVQYNALPQPSAWESIKTFFLILQKSFFYFWWYEIFSYVIRKYSWVFPISLLTKKLGTDPTMINESTPKPQIGWMAFKLLYIFLIINNIAYMLFISKDIVFQTVSMAGLTGLPFIKVLGSNAFNVLDNLIAKNWWHWILAFKGIIHYIFTGALIKTITGFTLSGVNSTS